MPRTDRASGITRVRSGQTRPSDKLTRPDFRQAPGFVRTRPSQTLLGCPGRRVFGTRVRRQNRLFVRNRSDQAVVLCQTKPRSRAVQGALCQGRQVKQALSDNRPGQVVRPGCTRRQVRLLTSGCWAPGLPGLFRSGLVRTAREARVRVRCPGQASSGNQEQALVRSGYRSDRCPPGWRRQLAAGCQALLPRAPGSGLPSPGLGPSVRRAGPQGQGVRVRRQVRSALSDRLTDHRQTVPVFFRTRPGPEPGQATGSGSGASGQQTDRPGQGCWLGLGRVRTDRPTDRSGQARQVRFGQVQTARGQVRLAQGCQGRACQTGPGSGRRQDRFLTGTRPVRQTLLRDRAPVLSPGPVVRGQGWDPGSFQVRD